MITLIAAISDNGVIGHDGKIPWHLPEDLKRFKELTMGKVVVMGRKTWESIPEKFRPLPGRTNVVLTRQSDYALPAGVERYASLADALRVHADEDVMVIGGGAVYAETMPLADALEITHVHRVVDGDAFFPHIEADVWGETRREDHSGYSFVTYRKKPM